MPKRFFPKRSTTTTRSVSKQHVQNIDEGNVAVSTKTDGSERAGGEGTTAMVSTTTAAAAAAAPTHYRLRGRSFFVTLAIGIVLGIVIASDFWTFDGMTSVGRTSSSSINFMGRQQKKDDFDFSNRDLIAYVSQGPAKSYRKIKERLERAFGTEEYDDDSTYRLFYHSYDKRCKGCIFEFKTSYARGKNLLIKTVVNAPEYHRFKYVVIFDDDAFMYHRSFRVKRSIYLDHPMPLEILRRHIASERDFGNIDLGWKSFHSYLLSDQETYPLVKPMNYHVDMTDPIDTYQSCTEENFWAVRPDHLHLFFPYMTVHEENFMLNAAVIYLIMERCFPAGMKVLNDWIVANGADRFVKDSAIYLDTDYKLNAQQEYLSKRLPELEPWSVPEDQPFGFLEQRCTVKATPSQGVHPECSRYTKEMFNKWINDQYEP